MFLSWSPPKQLSFPLPCRVRPGTSHRRRLRRRWNYGLTSNQHTSFLGKILASALCSCTVCNFVLFIYLTDTELLVSDFNYFIAKWYVIMCKDFYNLQLQLFLRKLKRLKNSDVPVLFNTTCACEKLFHSQIDIYTTQMPTFPLLTCVLTSGRYAFSCEFTFCFGQSQRCFLYL